MTTARDVDVVVIGGGVAGLSTALAASAGGRGVMLVTKESLDESSTRYAQGGVAAAVAVPDSPDLHLRDTVNAGAGLCDEAALRVLVDEGPARIAELLGRGARFDRDDGGLALAREGGHSMARILRAGGDATGAELQRIMGDLVRESRVDLVQDCRAIELLTSDAGGRCVGVRVEDYDGNIGDLHAADVVLATGGAGAIYHVTTNPDVATADGLAMAIRAGALVTDVEFVQFHPTALSVPVRPRPLISEAVRGEGAILRTAGGRPFMQGVHPMADLAPRDVVSRAVFRAMLEAGSDHVYLDATHIADFRRRFPTITRLCAASGLDPRKNWLPVAPAAHYFCGGVLTDLTGRTSIGGLWACGEVACTGVHGANRLASNSLLEGLVYGHRVGQALAHGDVDPMHTEGATRLEGRTIAVIEDRSRPTAPSAAVPVADAIPEIQHSLSRNAGVVRTAASLDAARRDIERIAASSARGHTSLENLLLVSDALVLAARTREESRGCHFRDDFPLPRPEWRFRIVQRHTPGGRVELLAWLA